MEDFQEANLTVLDASLGDPGQAVGPDCPVWMAVAAALRGAVERMDRLETNARLGDPDGIHHLRTATRRFRSELRTLATFIEPEWRRDTERELKWLAQMLGSVRDLDVLTNRLNVRIDRLDLCETERVAIAPIFESLAARREAALHAFTEAVASERYSALRVQLERAVVEKPWSDQAGASCEAALGSLMQAAWIKLKKPARKLESSDPDEAFHDVRKRAKRARYAAELVAPLLGRGSSNSALGFIGATSRVQGKLGDHHDSALVIEEIGALIRANSENSELIDAAQRLLAAERVAGRRSRKGFFREWKKLDRKKWRAWMKRRVRCKV